MTSPGRPPKSAPVLTPERIDAICVAYEAPGTTFRAACIGAGIAERTGRKWLERGEADLDEGDGASLEAVFYARFEKLRGARIKALFETSLVAEGPGAASARWWAERFDPKSLHLTVKQEHSGPEGGPIETRAHVVMLPPLGEGDDPTDGAHD